MEAIDCRLYSIEGMEQEKLVCDLHLSRCGPGKRVCVVLPVAESDLLYAQCNFRFESDDPGTLKMLQPIHYLRHAWIVLAGTHDLAEIHCLEPSIADGLRRTPMVTAPGQSLHVVYVDSEAASPPTPAPERLGLFSYLARLVKRRDVDWLENLETILQRFDGEIFDPAHLPHPLGHLRLRLLREIKLVLDPEARDDQRKRSGRAVRAFQRLGWCSPQAQELARLQAECLRDAHDNSSGERELRRRVGRWGSLDMTLNRIASWSTAELTLNIDHAQGYFDVMDAFGAVRSYCNDPNQIPRAFLGTSGNLDVETDLPLLKFEAGAWCEQKGNGFGALEVYSRLSEASWPEEKKLSQLHSECAKLSIIRVRTLLDASDSTLSSAIDELEAHLHDHAVDSNIMEAVLLQAKVIRWRLVGAILRKDASVVAHCETLLQKRLKSSEWHASFLFANCICEQARIHRLLAMWYRHINDRDAFEVQLRAAIAILDEFLGTRAEIEAENAQYFSIDCLVEKVETCMMFLFLEDAEPMMDELLRQGSVSFNFLANHPVFDDLKSAALGLKDFVGFRYTMVGRVKRMIHGWPFRITEEQLAKFETAREELYIDSLLEWPIGIDTDMTCFAREQC